MSESTGALTEVPYIGTQRADAFEDVGLDTPERVADASVELVADNVYGVGETDAERIVEGARALVDGDQDDEDEDVPLSAVEGLDGSTLDLSDETDDGSDAEEEQSFGWTVEFAEQAERAHRFERRLLYDEQGKLWYRIPDEDGGMTINPYNAPEFEDWCAYNGRDPEEMI